METQSTFKHRCVSQKKSGTFRNDAFTLSLHIQESRSSVALLGLDNIMRYLSVSDVLPYTMIATICFVWDFV